MCVCVCVCVCAHACVCTVLVREIVSFTTAACKLSLLIVTSVYIGQLYCLQARPIVTLPPSCFFEGEGEGVATLWDNSNIVESYSGVTSPLTFSFTSHAYEMVKLKNALYLHYRSCCG